MTFDYLVQAFHDWRLSLAAHPPYRELYPHYQEMISLPHLPHPHYVTTNGYVYTGLGQLPETYLGLLPRLAFLTAMHNPCFHPLPMPGEPGWNAWTFQTPPFQTQTYIELHIYCFHWVYHQILNAAAFTFGTVMLELYEEHFQAVLQRAINHYPWLVGGPTALEEFHRFTNAMLQYWVHEDGQISANLKVMTVRERITTIVNFFNGVYDWLLHPNTPSEASTGSVSVAETDFLSAEGEQEEYESLTPSP